MVTKPTAADKPPVNYRQGPATWQVYADELARWALERLVNRSDVWGGYYRQRDDKGNWFTQQTTHPKKADRGRVPLAADVLTRHFAATATRHVVGLHTTAPDNTSRWGAVDIDHHGDQSPDPATNWTAARAWYERLVERGFRPLLTDSNGKGGFHLLTLFREPVPTTKVYALMRWLVADHARHGLTAPPECFPKQPRIAEGRFGNWLRLPGRHHTREHWSRVWDGSRWLDGAAAVAYLLGLAGDPPGLIPAEAATYEPPKVQVNVRFVPAHPPRGGCPLDRRIRGFARKLPHLAEGQGRDGVAYRFAAWLVRDLGLSDEAALPWLEEWDRGNNPPKGTDALREIMGNARTHGKHGIGSGLDGRGGLSFTVPLGGGARS
jgi:hypothetical protein